MTEVQHDSPARVERRLADTPIAIVGMAGLFPGARNHREYWQNIVDAVDCTSDVPETHWRPEDYFDPEPSTDPSRPDTTYCTRGGFVPSSGFSPGEFGIPPNQLEVTTTVQLLSLIVARDLLRDAGAVGDDGPAAWYDPARTGVTLGVTGPMPLTHPMAARLETPVLKEVVRSCGLSDADAEAIAQKYLLAFPPWEENTFPGLLGNVTAGRIANRFDLGGMNCAVDAACASSLSALRLAASELAEGRADMMITGGCDTENTVFGFMCFSRTQALSKSGRIKPFDDTADGTLVGEGIGLLALKRLADAERDGDRIYAVVRGIGSSSDGRFGSIYAPRASGQELALRRAYTDADCSPASVELFEGHATGTAVGDRTELTALGSVLAEASDETGYAAIGSVKSQIGHTKGAAGTASLMKLALALHHKVLPPTINIDTPNKALTETPGALYPNTVTRPWIRDPRRPERRAAASAMGFGGTNFHVVLEEASADRGPTAQRGPRAHVWHATDPDALLAALRTGDAPAVGAVPDGDARIGFVSRTDVEAAELRELAVTTLARDTATDAWSHPRGIHYRRRARTDLKIAALFAGQGSQYVEMGRQTACDLPPVGAAFDAANSEFADVGADTLAAAVFPPPAFDTSLDATRDAALRRTEYAQPAIGALAAGQFAVLRDLGLDVTAHLGHSFGELTALWAAGALGDPGAAADASFFRLARARGRAMAPPTEVEGYDPGAMAAVPADRGTVEEVLADHPGVVVCNDNAPDQVVVGGGSDAVSAVVAAFAERGVAARPLPVAAAFHTEHVAHAVEAFRSALADVLIQRPRERVVPNTAGTEYTDDVEANRDVLAQQLRRPVEFADGVRTLLDDGVTVFVEFGPKQVLTGLVRRSAGDRDVVAIGADPGPGGDGAATLLAAAVQLVVLGAPLQGLDRYAAPAFVPVEPTGMTVTLTGMTHRPAARSEAYRAALADGYRIERPVREIEAAPVAAADVSGLPLPRVAASNGVPAAALAIPVPPSATAALPSTPVPAVGPTITGPSGTTDQVNDHLEMHGRYLDSQLRIAEGLVDVLRAQPGGTVAPEVQAGVRAVADSALAISRGHEHANDVLAAFSGLAGPAFPSVARPPTRAPVLPAAAPHELTAAGNGQGPLPAPVPAATVPAAASPAATAAFDEAAFAPAQPEPAVGPDPVAVRDALLAVVSEKTGYPTDMVEPGMDLETDLGIDSIKRVQILGAVAERVPGVTAVGPEQLAELRTVDDIVAVLASGAAASPVAAPAGPDAGAVRSALLAVVSEKTGYPVEMVEPGMDLETDLGIDSIKRVQILGAVAERVPGVTAVGPEQLAELRTVDDIVAVLAASGTAAAPASAPVPSGVDPHAVREALLAVVSEKTGYPVEMVEPGMDLETDLGIDSIKRVQILGAVAERVPGVAAVGPEQLGELRTVDDIVAVLAGAGAGAQAPTYPVDREGPVDTSTVDTRPRRSTIDLAPLPAVDRLADAYSATPAVLLAELGASAPEPLVAALRARGWAVTTLTLTDADGDAALFRIDEAVSGMQRLDACIALVGPSGVAQQMLADAVLVAGGTVEALRRTALEGSRAAFLTVTRVDGGLGHHGTAPLPAALLGGVTGLTKTLAREAPGVFSRAVDVAPELDDAALADVVVGELHDPDLLPEVGVDGVRARWTPVLTDIEPAGATPGGADPTGEVVLTADDVVLVTGGGRGVTALCTIALARRVPAEFLLLGRTELTDEPAWAAGVADDDLKAALITDLRHGTGSFGPREVEQQVAQVRAVREIRHTLAAIGETGARARYLRADVADPDAVARGLDSDAGRVTALVHGAGTLADAALPDKSPAAVHRVLEPKLGGLTAVLGALDGAEATLRNVVLFGSVAGVLGNPGQADYALANEALDRAAATLDGPDRHVTALHWGAWDGGMVTPALKELFAARGVALLAPDTGAAAFVEQLAPARRAQRSVLVAPGGALAPHGPEPVGAIVARRDTHTLSGDPVVADHRIGRHPVLPASAALGWMMRGAERAHRDLTVVGVRDFGVHRGIVLDGAEPTELELHLGRGVVEGATMTVPAAIRSADPDGRAQPHFGATLILAPAVPMAPAGVPGWSLGHGPEDGLDVYRRADLFHGPLLQGLRRVVERTPGRLVAECRLPDTPVTGGGWAAALHSPVLGDIVLQAASVLGVWHLDAGCLPLSVGSVELYAPLPADAPFVVVADDLRSSSGGVTVSASVYSPDGTLLQRWTDVGAVSTPDMREKFAEGVRAWLPDGSGSITEAGSR